MASLRVKNYVILKRKKTLIVWLSSKNLRFETRVSVSMLEGTGWFFIIQKTTLSGKFQSSPKIVKGVFKTKTKALNKAKKWMKSHPRGKQ